MTGPRAFLKLSIAEIIIVPLTSCLTGKLTWHIIGATFFRHQKYSFLLFPTYVHLQRLNNSDELFADHFLQVIIHFSLILTVPLIEFLV